MIFWVQHFALQFYALWSSSKNKEQNAIQHLDKDLCQKVAWVEKKLIHRVFLASVFLFRIDADLTKIKYMVHCGHDYQSKECCKAKSVDDGP